MEKKGFIILAILLILSTFFISAANETIQEKAQSCLTSKIDSSKCSSLSTEEKVFSLLAVGKCKTELLADASNKGCWPDSGCKIKTTAQAILALNKAGSSTTDAEKWLSSKNIDFKGIDWFLQVDATNETTCTAKYSGGTYSFLINEDKTIEGNAGTCLRKYQDYWFKISSGCYNQDFEISCSDSFMTSLLYKKTDSSTFYISDKTNSASAEGTTIEKANSLCFSEGTSCDYEGSLWAAIVLKFLGEDVSTYIPYLVSMADENSKYLPEAFLYILTDNFRTELLAKQIEEKWWAESGDKFYDTAVALFPFQNEESLAERTNSISWLGEVQGKDGCWQSNIRNTAFLFYSLWPGISISNLNDTALDCEKSNHFCMSKASCLSVSGETLENYNGCFGTNICCSKNKELESCSQQNGELCSENEECLGGTSVSASDTTSSKSCCIDGTCGIKTTSECEENSGTCRSSCFSSEESSSYSCSDSAKTCCVSKGTTAATNILVIAIIVILIVLVIIGIIFRQKIQQFFLRFRKGKGKPAQGPGPRFPPTSSARIPSGAVQRRIIPNQNQPVRRPTQDKSEFDDVLKKLKEIGK